MWVCDPEFVSRRLREITGEPLNSCSRILDPNKREITGVDCTDIDVPRARFCLLLGVSSGCAWPIAGQDQVTSVAWPVIG